MNEIDDMATLNLKCYESLSRFSHQATRRRRRHSKTHLQETVRTRKRLKEV